MGSKIDAIVNRLKEISEQKDKLCLVENVSSSSVRSWRATPTTSSPIEVVVYGRDEDKAKIIDLLMMNERNYDVIPIVGMGGTGKTTLAQHAYNDEAVVQAFEVKAWVCVSHDFDVERIMKETLENLTRKRCEVQALQSIQAELERALVGKRFLIVLDDIWKLSYDNWLALTPVFRVGASGSKIIVTTRQGEVASIVSKSAPYMLKLLLDDDCWLLFKTHAFKTQDVDMQTNSEVLRKKIIEKCKGLPLAARVLGGLRCSKTTDEWQGILGSRMWSAHEVEGGVLPVLRLSYHYLPRQLKKCFAYCAIFPQDYEFTEEELVLLWVAEGLIQQTKENKHVIEVGSMYFHEVVSMSIFQASTNHSHFIIHDLVHELAQEVAGDTCLRLERIEHSDGIPRARHVSYLCHLRDSKKRFEGLHRAELVRTFLPFSTGSYFRCYLANSVLHQLSRLKKLRVLSLRGYGITELPDSIGDLKHLRYLDLSSTDIRYLPESTCLLNNMQILLLRDCRYLQKLPSRMENLIDLLYLDITSCIALKEMPMGLKELKSLQVLPNFFVSKDDVSGVKDLMNFKDLRGTLCISNLENVADANDAKKANLNERKLNVLVLEWGRSFGEFRNVDTEKRVLDMLQPHQNLKELTIQHYAGNLFPKWLGVPSFSSMEVLTLLACERCTRLPPLGQLPSLKVLQIIGMTGVQSVGAEFYGSTCSKPFPSLESLTFRDMQGWESWSGFEVSNQVDVFSRLRELSLRDCPKLSGKLPNYLPSLKELLIFECNQLNIDVVSSFPELCKLEIFGCQGLAGASTIELKKVEDLSIVGDGCEELINRNLPCTFSNLSDCSMLERLPITFSNLKILKKLNISHCSSLVSLPIALLFSAVLEKLSIGWCDKLKSFLNEVEEDLDSNILSTSVRKKLQVVNCAFLERLTSRGGVFPVPLTDLTIRDCSELEFVAEALPASLRTLDIMSCRALKFVATTFVDGTKLESIEVRSCEKFQCFPDGLNSLSYLQKLKINHCPSFLSFPQGGLPSTNLTKLEIYSCKNVEALPNGMCNLTSLRHLAIYGCPCIDFVPEEGFLANLTELVLYGDNTIRPLMEWGLDKLTSLKELRFGPIGPDTCPVLMIKSLPISLTRLTISRFPIITLPSLPISLTHLTIADCPKLKSLPKEGLPPSLGRLFINGCPMVEKRCRRDKGKDWSKIADLPYVRINDKYIYERERERERERQMMNPSSRPFHSSRNCD